MKYQARARVVILAIIGINILHAPEVFGDSDTRQVLLNVKSSDRLVREKATEEFCHRTSPRKLMTASKDKQVVSLLLTIAENDNDEEVKNKAIYGLANVRDKETEKLMEKLSRGARGRNSRIAAIHTLTAVKGTGAIPILKEALVEDSDLLVKFHAARKLGGLGDSSGLRLGQDNLKNRDRWVRIEAANVLGAIGDPSTIQDLEQLKTMGREEEGAAIMALNEIEFKKRSKEIEKLQYLNAALHRKDASCGWAARKLVEIGSKESAQVLLNAARKEPKYSSEDYAAKGCAEPAFKSMFWDGTQTGEQKIQLMLKTGIILELPN